jgi:hypothetical protein
MFAKFFSLFKPAKAPLTAKELLKEATQLKKEKRYSEACDVLFEAFIADGSEHLTIKDYFRLPMYLQLDGKSDEGWRELNELVIKHTDLYSQAEIANQMRVFLQKEKKYVLALQFAAWHICKEIERDYSNIAATEQITDEQANFRDEYSIEADEEQEIYGETDKGNLITDKSYLIFKDRIEYLKSYNGLVTALSNDIKKAKLSEIEGDICQALFDYINSTQRYKSVAVRDILNKCVNSKV